MIVGATLNDRYYSFDDPTELAAYEELRRQQHRGLFGVPAVHGDTMYRGSDDGFGRDERSRKIARAAAREAGVNPDGKRYLGGLARFFGDPRAWIDKKQARSQIRKRCHDEGWGCEGAVSVPVRPAECGPTPLDQYEVADDIVEQEIARIKTEEKLTLTPKQHKQLFARTKERFSGK